MDTEIYIPLCRAISPLNQATLTIVCQVITLAAWSFELWKCIDAGGPDVPMNELCQPFDVNSDGDVDLQDVYQMFQGSPRNGN